jgi:hypothetical protein
MITLGEAIVRECSTMQKAFTKALEPQLTALDKLRRAIENSPRSLAQRAQVRLKEARTNFSNLCSMTYREMLLLVQSFYERDSLALVEQHSPPLLSRHLSSNAPPASMRTRSRTRLVST